MADDGANEDFQYKEEPTLAELRSLLVASQSVSRDHSRGKPSVKRENFLSEVSLKA